MWLTSDFLQDVKLRGFFPEASNITDAEFLRIGDSQIRTRIAPLVKLAEQEFWIDKYDTPFVSGQAEYRIPTRTMLGSLRKVVIVDQHNNEFDVARTTFDRLASYTRNAANGWYRALAYAVRGDQVVFTTQPDLNQGSWTVRMYYYRRPPRLVETSAAFQITGKSPSMYYLLGPVPASWTTSTVLDVIQDGPNFDTLARGLVPVGVTPGVLLTFTAGTYPGDLVNVGDWVTLAETSPVIPIPDLLYDLLVSATVFQALMTLGFMEQAAAFKVDLEERTAEIREILEPRVRAGAEKVINRSGYLRKGWGF